MTKPKIEVGQEVWVIYGYRGATLCSGKVTKVGRKYISVGRSKFETDTLQEVVKYGEPGRLYLSKEDYENEIELKKNIWAIHSHLPRYGQPTITLEQSRKILEILNS